ncbi:FAD-dependent oxidoreductase [Mycolicibacterium anyangense]|nr:FAD-dependent oxidoreductase [Mycolicibacterium anyangense]
MTYVITQPCCNDASCVEVCPVNCIHPTPEEAPFMKTEMLFIDPNTCIDCAACVYECPVDAIKAEDELDDDTEPYLALNAAYYDRYPIEPGTPARPPTQRRTVEAAGLRVALVGSGPAAWYAAAELLEQPGVMVNMFDRLPTPYGLIRAGVAPDHPSTKSVTDVFRSLGNKPGLALHLGVEVGMHLTPEELAEHHNAVIYAIGAPGDRKLGVPGEDLPGSHSATDFVAWYNGHPDYRHLQFDLGCERAVIVGNGNVALDVARIILSDPDELDTTDIAPHAVEALRHSKIEEVVILSRRGVAQAAYTNPEFLALMKRKDIDVVADPAEAQLDEVSAHLIESEGADPSVGVKVKLAQEAAATAPVANKRIVFRYLRSPEAILGDESVDAVRVVRNELVACADGSVIAKPTSDTEVIETGLVLRSVGYHGRGLAGVPFDETRGVIPNSEGRVLTGPDGDVVAGQYVAGWIKRGPSGVIGTNKRCAAETVAHVLDDFERGRLHEVTTAPDAIGALVRMRQPDVVDYQGWMVLDRAEVSAGARHGRLRLKFTDVDEMFAVVRKSRSS